MISGISPASFSDRYKNIVKVLEWDAQLNHKPTP